MFCLTVKAQNVQQVSVKFFIKNIERNLFYLIDLQKCGFLA